MTFGLILFVTIVVLDSITLLVDLTFRLTGVPTITSWVRKHLWAGIILVVIQFGIPIGLFLHFFGI
jgi:hypothetical protein